MARTVSQVDARLTAEITARAAADAKLDARLKALEAPTPTPVPTPVASGPVVIPAGAANVVIEGKSINLALGPNDAGIRANGTAANPVRGLTIRNCTITGGNVSILLYHVRDLVIEDVTLDDSWYAGILALSCIGGRITRPTIRRVGNTKVVTGDPANNSYGIALTRNATPNFTADPRSSDFLIEDGLLEDIPLWHGYDTHAGQNITFRNCTTRRVARPFFITTDADPSHRPLNVSILGARMEQAISKTGGTNKQAITLANLSGGTIANAKADPAYGLPVIFDYVEGPYTGSQWIDGGGNGALP